MATIKLQPSGAVLLKDGKVSCSCCEVCCPYPAQALVDGLYTYEDLPDAIDIEGLEFTKLDPPQFLGGVTIYYIYPNNEDFNLEGGYSLSINDFTSGSFWASDFGQDFCLLNDATYKDQFADSYNWLSDDPFSGDPYNPVSTTVTRVSLCRWEGPRLPFGGFFCRPALILYKGLNDVPNEYAFVWRMQWEGDIAETAGDKIGFNNTPVGEYDADPTPGTWVIS